MADSEIFLRQALVLAHLAATRDEVPVGAVLVHNGVVIGQGSNRREETHRTAAHAEMVALEDYNLKAGEWRLPPETTLYVTAEPCLMCTGALLWARATHLIYGCRDTKNAGLEKIRSLIEAGVFDHRFASIQSEMLGDECAKVLSDYFRQKRQRAKQR